MASEIDFKSIIELCRTKFRSCVSSDRLVSALHVGQVLSAEEVLSVQDLPLEKRVDASLDLVKSKGYDGFRKLCVSLETTYPYMLNCMFLGVEPPCVTQNVRSHPEHTEKADTSTAKHKSRHFNSLPRKVVVDRRSSGTGSDSYNYNSLVEEFNNEVDEQGKAESRYLIDRSDDGGLLKRKNTKEDYDRIQTQCVGAMHEVSSLRHQHAEMVNRCELAVQEADYYRRQHQAMGDRCDHLVREGQVLRHQCEEIKSAKEKLQQDYEEIVLLREQEKSSLDMMQHGDQRSIDSVSNSSRAWDRAMSDVDSLHREKEAILEDYDDLKTNYTLLTSKLAKAQEDTSRMREKLESVVPERDALHVERNALKQQCTAAIRGYDKALRERDESLHTAVQAEQQRDLALKECDQVFALRVKFNKDVSRLQDERNAALNEYKLVMSERDSVHREIERLQDEIGELSTTNVSLKEEKDKMKQETECLHQEIVLVLADRDKARKESYDRRERLQEALKDKECVVKRLEEIQQDVEMLKQERNAARKERSEAIVHRDKILKECFQVQKMFDVYGDRHEETNSFKLQFENLSQELTKAWNEAEVAMMRRDWAFNERDKIVRELQMLRDDYDQRTKEREEMISELHFAHDELETVTKKHNKAQRELHHLRKHCNSYMTKEERLQMLSSVDSAIDTDSQDYNMETVTFEKIDTAEDLGFTIGGGSDLPLYPTDSSVFVVDVVPGSLAEGKLKVNDCLLRANSIDLSNVDFNTANKALRSRDTLTMTFLRKRPSRAKNFVQHVNMRMTLGRDLGLSIDSGLHIKKIEPGSVAADVELLSIGDKILMINQVPVDHLPYEDAKRLLKTSTLSLTIFKENASRRSSRRSLTDFLTYREKTMTVGHSERASPADDDDKPVVAHFRSPSAPVPSMSYTVKASSLNGPTHVRCSSAINPTATYNGSDTLLSSTRNERILTDEEREKILKELLTKDRHNKCIEAPATVSASTPVVSAEAKTDDTRSSSATPPPPMRSNSYMSAVLTQRPTTEHGDLHLNLESAANFYQKSKPRSGYIYNAPRSNSVGSSSMTRVALTPADSSGKVTPSSPHNMNRSDPLALSQKTSAMYADHHHRSHNSSHQSVNYVQTWGVGKRTRHPPVYNILNRPQSATPIGVEHPASPGDPIKADDSKFSRAFENVLTHIPNPYQNEKQYYGTFPGKGRRSHAGPAVDLIEHFALANPPATAKSSTIPSTKPSNFRASSSHGSLNSSVSSDRATPVSKLVYPSIQPVYEEENGELVEANYFQAQSPSQQDGVPLFETHFQPITDESQPRRVVIEKNAYPLGISIAQSAQGGVFVSAVNEGSNAERCGLQYGDQILELVRAAIAAASSVVASHLSGY